MQTDDELDDFVRASIEIDEDLRERVQLAMRLTYDVQPRLVRLVALQLRDERGMEIEELALGDDVLASRFELSPPALVKRSLLARETIERCLPPTDAAFDPHESIVDDSSF
jgi:hypothetical protein